MFCDEIENVGAYISSKGYDAYARANADLAQRLVRRQTEPIVMALSSGSLVTTGLSDIVAQTRALVREPGVSVALIPGGAAEEAAAIVVARQLTRGFGHQPAPERRKFLERVEAYRALADFCVDSSRTPAEVAQAIADRLTAG